jgi:uncharacterized protein
MRTDIEFLANGTTLRGWLYTPDQGDGPFPCIVMAHGFSAVKEQTLPEYAEVFAEAGLASLVYDNRCLGESDGEPRQDIDPIAQARDYRDAITFAQSREQVDADRVGVWGTSYSGGQALMVAAVDRRAKAVVVQVPLISGLRNTRRLIPEAVMPVLREQIDEERAARQGGAEPALIQVCTDDPTEPHAFPGLRTFNYFSNAAAAERWRNECTVRSLDYLLEMDVTPFLPLISPTPLLMIVGKTDLSTPNDEAIAAYSLAHDPKELLVLPGDHYGSYLEDFDLSANAARDFFLEHLGVGSSKPLSVA